MKPLLYFLLFILILSTVTASGTYYPKTGAIVVYGNTLDAWDRLIHEWLHKFSREELGHNVTESETFVIANEYNIKCAYVGDDARLEWVNYK